MNFLSKNLIQGHVERVQRKSFYFISKLIFCKENIRLSNTCIFCMFLSELLTRSYIILKQNEDEFYDKPLGPAVQSCSIHVCQWHTGSAFCRYS